jgi:FlaG/FlaF family flagellin (archaellin)
MKRITVIVGIVVAIAAGIGAFVIADGNESSEAKSPTQKATTTTEKQEQKSTKDFALAVAGAAKTSSGAPVPKSDDKKSDDKKSEDQSDDNESDDQGDDDNGYEARKQFVGVSPSKVKAGKTIEVQVRGFKPNVPVKVIATPKNGGPVVELATIKPNSKGRGKLKVVAPAVGEYKVSIDGAAKPTTKLTVKSK